MVQGHAPLRVLCLQISSFCGQVLQQVQVAVCCCIVRRHKPLLVTYLGLCPARNQLNCLLLFVDGVCKNAAGQQQGRLGGRRGMDSK